MILSLSILRGVDLMAMDSNLVSDDSSDPYCKVYVNDQKIGWTVTRSQTLNPVWGGPSATFKFKGGGGTKIFIKIVDRDELSKDDPMGTVTFYAKDLLSRNEKNGYPNFWASVEPPKGYNTKYAGRLQVRLLEESETDVYTAPLPNIPEKLTAGPELEIKSKKSLQKAVSEAKAPVFLHIYDCGTSERVHKINRVLPATGMGGIFHGGIEIYGKEHSFGGGRAAVCGIFNCEPASCPIHSYRESIYLGDCKLTKKQVLKVLRILKPEWMANTYNLLCKNCVYFCNEFAIELGVGGIPEWVYSLAELVAQFKGVEMKEPGDSLAMRKSWTSVNIKDDKNPVEDLTLATVMAIRLQKKFRARKRREGGSRRVSTVAQVGSTEIRRASATTPEWTGYEVQKVGSY